ncbi:helix-turn-helix domain-containing protein [Streptomyces piniterrae]|uniref:helix-turn-helix domain-containing protein n=1 Tax=Streptomyces piniterrae TaxID=2571125 RepID=UPI001FE338F3|nr:helix-turn-helix transcriptional regulator [Streptomyces piniterrae]
MSGARESQSVDDFAALLRQLKDRSGLSYGTLAKRMHMSTSTLHRYCNGSVIPSDYAPVQRLARLCKASPEEMVDLHRHWILADAARGRGRSSTPKPAVLPSPPEPSAPETSRKSPREPEATRQIPGTQAVRNQDEPHEQPVPREQPAPREQPVQESPETPQEIPQLPLPDSSRRRTHRRAALAVVASAAVMGAVALAVGWPYGQDAEAGQQQTTSNSSTSPPPSKDPAAAPPSRQASPSPSDTAPPDHASPSTAAQSPGTTDGHADKGRGTPLTVIARPYAYTSPCSQHFLVDREPEFVGPPAAEQDASRWAAAYGAVSSDEQTVALTVQGTGKDTVVLEALHVRIMSKAEPLAWKDYSMGVGCGGNVTTKSFDVNLDAGSPTTEPTHGQRDFPYKVSESDPEVFYVSAHTSARDVRWDLTLEWSSGSRHGTVRIDDHGTPFRTSANADRPGYDYPLGGGKWDKRQEQQG